MFFRLDSYSSALVCVIAFGFASNVAVAESKQSRLDTILRLHAQTVESMFTTKCEAKLVDTYWNKQTVTYNASWSTKGRSIRLHVTDSKWGERDRATNDTTWDNIDKYASGKDVLINAGVTAPREGNLGEGAPSRSCCSAWRPPEN